MGDTAALRLWADLSRDLRDVNRSSAGDIGAKLREVQCTVAPLGAGALAFAFTDLELERLARLEHERWLRARLAAGWRYAPVRDDAAKRNPAIRGWLELPEEERQKNRDAVGALPDVLADAGLRIVRLTR